MCDFLLLNVLNHADKSKNNFYILEFIEKFKNQPDSDQLKGAVVYGDGGVGDPAKPHTVSVTFGHRYCCGHQTPQGLAVHTHCKNM